MGTKWMFSKIFFLNRGGSFDLGDSMEGALSSEPFSPPVYRVNSDKFYIHYGPQFTHYKPKGWGEVCSDTEEPHSTHFLPLLLGFWLLQISTWSPKVCLPSSQLLSRERCAWGGNARKASHLLHNAWMKDDETYFFFCKQSSCFLSL